MSVDLGLPTRYRAIWISDFHIGTRRAQTGMLLDFLKYTESETLYLVGDIIDNWSMQKTWFWDQGHNDVIQKLLRKARKGTRVVYIPGNHDERFRDFVGARFGRIAVRQNAIHITADKKRYLVLHGDKFDGVVKYARWLAVLGDKGYEIALWLNHHLKRRVKQAVQFVSDFEQAVVREAKKRRADGVICGHIHTPEMSFIDGVHYCNDGDWVESCSALVEHHDGRFELIHWADRYTSDEPLAKTKEESTVHAHQHRDRRLAPAN